MTLTQPHELIHESHGEQIRVSVTPGSDGQVPLLICSGFGITLDMLDAVVDSMPGATIIRFDAPGLSRPRGQLPFYRFSRLAKILDDLLEKLGYPQVDLYGISWGGMLAQEFALNHPERCRKLILASTLSGMVSLPGNLFLDILLSPGKWFLNNKYSKFASLVYGGKVLKSDWLELEHHFAIHHAHLPGYIAQIGAVMGWTSIHRLPWLTQPVLLLYGSDDTVIPLINAVLLNKIIPNAQLIKLDCGHLFPLTRSRQVQKEIYRFRSEHNAQSKKEV